MTTIQLFEPVAGYLTSLLSFKTQKYGILPTLSNICFKHNFLKQYLVHGLRRFPNNLYCHAVVRGSDAPTSKESQFLNH
jgi:hypothetical protein